MLHEDEHLLVVNKPPGWNTHSPSPYAGEGLYDWLRHREPRWAALAIVHRLDKETSGVIVFGKTPLANRSLTGQFTQRSVHKRYLLVTDRPVSRTAWRIRSRLIRRGDRYVSQSPGGEGDAETVFKLLGREAGQTILQAEPLTGRTHQIRVHATESGLPILGDTRYGGSPFSRVCLHAEQITFQHPATLESATFTAPVGWHAEPGAVLRAAFVDAAETNCHRLIHGASDDEPGWYVDRLGDYLLSQSDGELGEPQRARLTALSEQHGARGAYHKRLDRQVRRAHPEESMAQRVQGTPAPERFPVRENGVTYELSFEEGYSVGLFLDQRDNRRRFLTGFVPGDFNVPARGAEMLNVFAYTCGFSVCASLAGARTTSLDLSKKYLTWGRRNFELNGIDPAAHDFIFGDAFDWLRRLSRKGRRFEVIVLDPPTFSKSKASGIFRAEKDYGRLVTAALPLLKPGGVLLTSTNAGGLAPEAFLESVAKSVQSSGRGIGQQCYVPQPPDFPVSRGEPAYLKTCWWRIK